MRQTEGNRLSLSAIAICNWRPQPPVTLREPLMRFVFSEYMQLREFVCSSSHALKYEFQEHCE